MSADESEMTPQMLREWHLFEINELQEAQERAERAAKMFYTGCGVAVTCTVLSVLNMVGVL